MKDYSEYDKALLTQGFIVIDDIYTVDEIEKITQLIEEADQSNDAFRKTSDLFAIRKCLTEIPELLPVVFNKKVKEVINRLFGEGYFVSKSIYFDKPQESNWFVAWHRDLTISVDKKVQLRDFSKWTVKNNQFAVQPPLLVLQDNFTIRIHLDKTDKDNGALKVIPGSHLDKELAHSTTFTTEEETVCNVNAGGIMIMRPLILHSSHRTTNNKRRRVLHIEFSRAFLPKEIKWSERMEIPN